MAASRPPKIGAVHRVVGGESIILICPIGAKPNSTIYFQEPRSRQARKTKVPPGVKPGQRFTVSRDDFTAVSRSTAPQEEPPRRLRRPTSAAALPRKREQQPTMRERAASVAAIEPPLRYTASAKRLDNPLSDEDKRVVADYKERIRTGKAIDQRWWTDQGFKAVGKGMSEQKMKDYGHGVPKWSPYYKGDPTKQIPEELLERSSKALGDQPWWEQYGFKGAVSEQKKADYGNGVPKWSPYHHGKDHVPGEKREPPLGLPADAFWFAQFGFKTTGLTEAKRRDYGHGVPSWSPYYRLP